jgi:hypothetical protein
VVAAIRNCLLMVTSYVPGAFYWISFCSIIIFRCVTHLYVWYLYCAQYVKELYGSICIILYTRNKFASRHSALLHFY